jgi:predicted MFS family arabinose efflux permease
MVARMNRKSWVMLAVLFLARTTMGFQFQTAASIGPSLMESLSIDNAQMGFLIGLYLLPGLPIAVPGGIIGQRFGARHVVLAGLVLMVLGGMLSSLASDFTIVAAGRVVGGTGAVLLNVMLTKLVADWFTATRTATAMAVLVTSWPVGIALGLVCGPSIALAFGWAALLQFSAGLTALALVLFVAIYRDPPGLPPAGNVRFNLGLNSFELLMVSVAGAIWATYNVAYIVLISFAPPLFTAHGYSIQQSGWLVSLLGWVMIPMIPLGGYLTDRLGRPTLLMAGGFIVAVVSIAAMACSESPVIWLAVIAVITGVPSGAIMALPVSVLRPEVRAAGMGIYYTFYYTAMALLPALAGMARDRTGSVAAPLLFSAGMMALALLLLIVFRILGRPQHSAAVAPS